MEKPPCSRAAETGKRIAVVGAGPAGQACALRLAMKGHDVVRVECRAKPGGLSDYGIAAYKVTQGFARAQVDWLLQSGGIEIRTVRLSGKTSPLLIFRRNMTLSFMGIGLSAGNALLLEGEALPCVQDAVDFSPGCGSLISPPSL